MALNTQLSDASANAAVNAMTARVNSGTIKIYTGSQPANGNSSLTGTLLATIALGSTAFASASAGSAALNTTSAVTAVATGTAGYFAVCNSGGTAEWMGSIGLSSANLVMGSTSITSGASVQVTSYTFSVNEAGS